MAMMINLRNIINLKFTCNLLRNIWHKTSTNEHMQLCKKTRGKDKHTLIYAIQFTAYCINMTQRLILKKCQPSWTYCHQEVSSMRQAQTFLLFCIFTTDVFMVISQINSISLHSILALMQNSSQQSFPS